MGRKKPPAVVEQDEEPEIPEQEQAAVKALLGEIDRAKTLRKTFDNETLPKLRRYAWGTRTSEALKDSSDVNDTRTNLIYATMATLLPHTYAKNPEIAVSPTEAVGEDEYEMIKEFGKTCQVMLNNLFVDEAKLKRRAKSNVRSAMGTSVGWLKMSFQKSLQGDPIIIRRANDIQDNLRRIEYLVMQTKKETDVNALHLQRAELQQQLKTVMDSPEMKIFKGFVIDRVQFEDMFILDESIVEFDDYSAADKLCHRVLMTDDQYAEAMGSKIPKGATVFDEKAVDEYGNAINLSENQKIPRRAVYEVWDKTTNTVCCVCDGVKGYAKKPRIIKPASERWYPFFALGFNLVEGRWRPLSDVELLMKLQDEYNRTRYLFAEARKEAIPTRVFRKAGNLTEEDIKALTNRKPGDWIGVEGNPTVPIDQDIAQLPGIAIDPEAYDVTIIRNDMDLLVGLSDASRANLIEAKTATEAEIMRQALQTRVAERQDTNEDLISEMATSALEVMLQEYTINEVKQIVGQGAVWPEMDVESIFRKVKVSVRAGSTGKPNVTKERESWAMMMPIINDTITQVMELRMSGQFDLANSKIELLKETLHRYDEKIDVDQFIPKQEMDESGQPIPMVNAMAQVEEMQKQMETQQQELEAAKQEIVALNQKLLEAQHADNAKVADIEANKMIAIAQQSAKEAEAQAKAAEANARVVEAAEKEQRVFDENKYKIDEENKRIKEVERMKIDSNERIATADRTHEKAMKGEDAKEAEAGRQHETEEAGKEREAKDGETKAADKGAGAIASAAKALEKAAQAVAEAASMDKVPEYDKEGRITRVTSKRKETAH